MSRLLRLAAVAAVTLLIPGTAVASPLDVVTGYRPGLLSGPRLSPSPVVVDGSGAMVGASLSYRLSAAAMIGGQIVDDRGRNAGVLYQERIGPVDVPFPAGTGTVPINAPGPSSLSYYGAPLRAGRRYLVIFTASTCPTCSRLGERGSAYDIELRWFRTVAAPPAAV